MKIIKQYITVVTLVFLVPLMASAVPYFEDKAPPSLADRIPLTRSQDPVDPAWLPEIIGLPSGFQVTSLTQHMIDVMMQETDSRCTSISQNLRMMIFQHFVVYQHMLNAQAIYLDEEIAHQWAHVLAMILKESSGDSANITDMCGYSISTDQAKTNLKQWREIVNLSHQKRIDLNYQTNFGLTQTSADRLMDAFRLSKDQQYDTEFLEGNTSAASSKNKVLNTAIAIRRLIWFYQGFAQGRIEEDQGRLDPQQINDPQFAPRYKTGLERALLYCGTHYMFDEAALKNKGDQSLTLENAMASIAFCSLGNQHTGFGNNQVDELCFAAWVTLCPALNVDIATLSPLSYFATRNQKPVCEDTFKRLINKKPGTDPDSIIVPLR